MRRNEDEMYNQKLADLLFPEVVNTPEYYEEKFPYRKLPNKAEVTRMAPSPTGFIHLGNLYSALADERIAHRNGGVFYLRIEDTDEKRKVDGAVETIILILNLMRVLALMIQIQEMLMDHISRDRELKYIIHMLRAL